MENDGDRIREIRALASDVGLTLRGWFSIGESDQISEPGGGMVSGVLLLFGQTGSLVWDCFSRSPEYSDGKADPMDRWSYRTGSALADELGGTALFPFDGPPWHPFGQWAQRAENIRPSPLGILMHPQYGLWHAYRFAIALRVSLESSNGIGGSPHVQTGDHHACDHCKEQPCLIACPVNAFTDGAYDVRSCAEYLRNNAQAQCHSQGCLARGACPQANEYIYDFAHRQFHMRQFHDALEKPDC